MLELNRNYLASKWFLLFMVTRDQTTTRKIGISFTNKQIELIDRLVNSGELGGSRAEAIKTIVMFYLKEKDNHTNF